EGEAAAVVGVTRGDAVGTASALGAGIEDEVVPGGAVRRTPGVQLSVLHAGHVVACWAWACWARWAAIHAAPQASRSSSRSAALTARTICGDRASMMALVRPAEIAIGRKAAPTAWRAGQPDRTVD